MAVYRNVSMDFWTDTKVVDDLSPEDRYFMLYILTNPHTNLCGCYEISMKQMARETGYNIETIEKLIDRFNNIYKVFEYNIEHKEIHIKNWHKYNWTKSVKLDKPLLSEIEYIKTPVFKRELVDLYNKRDTVSIPYTYTSDTTVSVSVTDTVSNTVSVNTNNTNNNINTNIPNRPEKNNFDYKAKFNEFWNEYPKKVAKQKCMEKFKQVCTTEKDFSAILQGLRKYNELQYQFTDTQYIPNPMTWLNQERWKDEPIDLRPKESKNTKNSKNSNVSYSVPLPSYYKDQDATEQEELNIEDLPF